MRPPVTLLLKAVAEVLKDGKIDRLDKKVQMRLGELLEAFREKTTQQIMWSVDALARAIDEQVLRENIETLKKAKEASN